MLLVLRNAFGILMLGVTLLTACSTTQVNSVWKDPAYQAHPARIMVVGVSRNPLNRRLFEDEFVLQLKAHGTEAIASYTVLADKQQDDHAAIAAKVVELGADTVLVTRLVSKRTVKTYVPGTLYFPPPHYGTWQDYYGYGYQALATPGYMTESEYAVIETNLYDAANDKLIWAASSETGISGQNHELIKSYIGVMVNNMVGQGLLTR